MPPPPLSCLVLSYLYVFDPVNLLLFKIGITLRIIAFSFWGGIPRYSHDTKDVSDFGRISKIAGSGEAGGPLLVYILFLLRARALSWVRQMSVSLTQQMFNA